MQTPRLIRKFQQHGRWFKAADDVLKILFSARGGGPLTAGLAMVSAAGSVVNTMFPPASGWEKLATAGLQEVDLTVGGFLCELLMGHTSEIIDVSQWGVHTHLWRKPNGEPLAGAMFLGGQFSTGPYVRGGYEDFHAAIREIVWSRGNSLQLTAAKGTAHSYRSSGRFRLEEMTPLGSYIGKKRPEWYADRLRRYAKGRSRTILFRGPTGAGKSVLARHVCQLLKPDSARTLKISSEVLRKCRSDEVKSIIRCFQPTVLLLDDLNLDAESGFFLDLLEMLRDPNTLVVVTVMTKFEDKDAPKPGSWHSPGMRPGRVDETFTLGAPDAEEREAILDHYCGGVGLLLPSELKVQVVEATAGLTGAYLGDIVKRLAAHGVENWRHEVNQVLYTAPFAVKEEEKKEPNAAPIAG